MSSAGKLKDQSLSNKKTSLPASTEPGQNINIDIPDSCIIRKTLVNRIRIDRQMEWVVIWTFKSNEKTRLSKIFKSFLNFRTQGGENNRQAYHIFFSKKNKIFEK